jgi:hypothetical protein
LNQMGMILGINIVAIRQKMNYSIHQKEFTVRGFKLMTQDEAHRVLEPHYPRICGAVVEGYRKYRKYPGRTIHHRRTRATIVNDEILACIIAEFDGVPETKLVEIRAKNLRFLKVGDRVLLWFKKIDRLRRPRVYPTLHAQQLEAGGQLSFFPDCTILVVGYLLNLDETKVVRVSISKPAGLGLRPEWFIDLQSDEDKFTVFRPEQSSQDAAPRVRVIVKKGAVQDKLLEG